MSSKTIRETSDATIKENNSNATVRESTTVSSSESTISSSYFRNYKIIRQLPTKSTEADIFVVSKDDVEYILKKYRFGYNPKQEILNEIKTLSENYPDNFIRVFESDFDQESKSYYEIQEYAQKGTLSDIIENSKSYTEIEKATLFSNVASQVGVALHNLHENNLLHLDIKPSNILLRSKQPLEMVLTDFGIATSLDSDMSKKFTNTRGTPMYQSPESYSGVMGRATDWWGLGMILLEIANGSHPFSNLDARIISNAIITKSVDIPESIDKDRRKLIRGLLTRDTEKRWNWEQVSRWLNGEHDIPDYFEESSEVGEVLSYKKPLNFMGEKFYTLEKIAIDFARDEDHWNKGKEFIMRGYVKQWLESNNEFEHALDFENEFLSNTSEDGDLKTFRFICKYGKNLPFIFCGKIINIKNLFLFLGKQLKNEKILSAAEQKIVNFIVENSLVNNKELSSMLRLYVNSFGQSENAEALENFTKISEGKKLEFVVSTLDIFVNLQKYYVPFIKDNSASPEQLINSLSELPFVPCTREHWKELNDKYILPKPLVDETFSISTYESALARIKNMAESGDLIPHDKLSKKERNNLSLASMEDYNRGFEKWVLGYSDEIIESLRTETLRLKSLITKADEVGKAEINLFLDYLSILPAKKFSVTIDDITILKTLKGYNKEGLLKFFSKKHQDLRIIVLTRLSVMNFNLAEYHRAKIERCEEQAYGKRERHKNLNEKNMTNITSALFVISWIVTWIVLFKFLMYWDYDYFYVRGLEAYFSFSRHEQYFIQFLLGIFIVLLSGVILNFIVFCIACIVAFITITDIRDPDNKLFKLSVFLYCIILISVMLYGGYRIYNYHNSPEVIAIRQKEIQKNPIRDEVIAIAHKNDFEWTIVDVGLLGAIYENSFRRNNSYGGIMLPDGVDVYAYHTRSTLKGWFDSKQPTIVLSSDGLRWRIGNDETVHFVPYDGVHRNVYDYPELIKVQAVVNDLSSQKFRKILDEAHNKQ